MRALGFTWTLTRIVIPNLGVHTFLQRYVANAVVFEVLERICGAQILFVLLILFRPYTLVPTCYYWLTNMICGTKPPMWNIIIGCIIYVDYLSISYHMYLAYYLLRYLVYLANVLTSRPMPSTILEIPNTCFICCEEYVVSTKLEECNHVIHTPCLIKWFDRAKTCPICRSVSQYCGRV